MKNHLQKIIALVLALVMTVGCLPLEALAAPGRSGTDTSGGVQPNVSLAAPQEQTVANRGSVNLEVGEETTVKITMSTYMFTPYFSSLDNTKSSVATAEYQSTSNNVVYIKVKGVAEGSTKVTVNYTAWKLSESVYFNVNVTAPKVTVRFLAPDGSVIETQEVVKDSQISAPASNPTEEDKIFKGWSESKDGQPLTTLGTASADKDFYAVFADGYRVRFVDGANELKSDLYEVGTKNAVVPPETDPTAEHKTFLGWSMTENGEVIEDIESIEVDTAAVFYAVYEDNYYVRFVALNETVQEKEYTGHTDFDVEAPAAPVNDKLFFVGWSLTEGSEDLVEDFHIEDLSADVTYYAVYHDGFTVKFIVNGEELSRQTFEAGSVQTVAVPDDPTVEDLVFDGWALSEGGVPVGDSAFESVTEDTTFYALFHGFYTVNFVVNGQTVKTQKLEAGKGLVAEKPADPQIPEMYFDGWAFREYGTPVDDAAFAAIEKDTTFYAVFHGSFKVTFYQDNTLLRTDVYEEGKTVTVIPPEMADQSATIYFAGWSETKGGPLVDDIVFRSISEDAEFYAVYSPMLLVEFYYDDTLLQSENVRPGRSVTPPTPELPAGYVLVGWAEKRGGNVPVLSRDFLNISVNKKYYAILKQAYRVSYYDMDNQLIETTESESVTVTLPEMEQKSPYIVVGWANNYKGGIVSYTDAAKVLAFVPSTEFNLNGDTGFYATYREPGATFIDTEGNTYFGTFDRNAGIIVAPATSAIKFDRTGYELLGWTTAAKTIVLKANESAEGQIVTSFQDGGVYHPVLRVRQYTVTFMDNGEVIAELPYSYGDALGTPSMSNEIGFAYVIGAVDALGNMFMGWVDSDDSDGKAVTVITDNTTVYAAYTPEPLKDNEFLITFIDEDGSVIERQKVVHDDITDDGKAVPPNGFEVPEDYIELIGWATEEGEMWDFSKVVRGNMTLQAVYRKFYLYTYVVEGVQGGGSQQYRKNEISYPLAEEPYIENQKFMGWREKNSNVNYTFGKAVNANRDLFAHFSDIYYVNYANLSVMTDEFAPFEYVVDDAPAYNFPTEPTRYGFTFRYWSLKKDGAKVEEDTVRELLKHQDVTLYAVWDTHSVPVNIVIWEAKVKNERAEAADGVIIPTNYNYVSTTTGYAVAGAILEVNGRTINGLYKAADLKSVYTAEAEKDTYFEFEATDADGYVVPGAAATVNVYYERKEYALRFLPGTYETGSGWNKTQNPIYMKYKDVVYSNSNPYTIHAELDEDLIGDKEWPLGMTFYKDENCTETYDTDFYAWEKLTNTQVSKVLTMTSAACTRANQYGSVSASYKGGSKYLILYMFQSLPGEAVHKTNGGKNYTISLEYSQISPSSLSHKAITGLQSAGSVSAKTELSDLKLINGGDTVAKQVTGYTDSAKPMILFYDRVSFNITLNLNDSEPVGNEVIRATLGASNYSSTSMVGGSTAYLKSNVLFGTQLSGCAPTAVPTRDKCSFDGWYADAACIEPFDFSEGVVNANKTAYARWIVNPISLTFYLDSENMEEYQTYPQLSMGSIAPTLANPTDNPVYGHFAGWYYKPFPGSNYTTEFIPGETVLYDDAVVYARWSSYGFRLIYDPANGSKTWDADRTYELNELALLGDCTVTNGAKVFTGWRENGTGAIKQPGDSITIYHDTVMQAVWADPEKTNQIRYHSNDVSARTVTQNVLASSQGKIRSNTFEREGYSFTGWNTKADGTGNEYVIGSHTTVPNSGIDLYAQWSIDSFTVSYTFEATDTTNVPAKALSQLPVEQTYNYGTSVSVAADPYVPGYTFLGWITDDATVNSGRFNVPANDVTFVGTWQEDDAITVQYVALEHGSVNRSSETVAPVTENLLGSAAAADAGYEVEGWYADKDCTIKLSENAYFNPGRNEQGLNEAATYYARFKERTYVLYEVNYYEQGTTNKVRDRKTVNDKNYVGDEVTEYPVDVPGYTKVSEDPVTKILKDSGNKFEFYYIPNTDTQYEVRYYLQDLTADRTAVAETYTLNNTITDLTGTSGVKVTAEVPDVTGFVLNPNAAGSKLEGKIAGDGSLVLKVYYDRVLYTVDFNDYDDRQISTGEYPYGSVVVEPDVPSRKSESGVNFYFHNWKNEETGETEVTPVTGDTTYRAEYTDKLEDYTVIFYDEDGKTVLGGSDKLIYHYGDIVTVPMAPTKAATAEYSYEFSWNKPVVMTVTQSASYIATFIAVPNVYTLTYRYPDDFNDGAVFVSEQHAYGDPVDTNDGKKLQKREGYSFTGWANETVPSTMPARDVACIAQYEKNTYKLNVWHDFKGIGTPYSEHILTDVPYEYGEQYSYDVPEIPGFTADQSGTVTGTMPAGNETLRITYTANLYTVKFLDEDGTEIFVKADYLYGDSVILPDEDPTKSGFRFVGWDKDVADIVYEDAVYTAVYEADEAEYTIKYRWIGAPETDILLPVTGTEKIGETLSVFPETISGYTAVDLNEKTITVGSSGNEIIFYYYKNVVLTAIGDIVTYDGKEHEVSGYFNNLDLSLAFDPEITVSASGVNAGNYDAKFEGAVNRVDMTGFYIVSEAIDAELRILPVTEQILIKIIGDTNTVTYDGKEHCAEGFTAVIPDSSIVIALQDSATAKVTGINADAYKMGLSEESFTVTSGNYSNIKLEVEDGSLTVEPLAITVNVTGENVSKTYDGTEYTATRVTFSSESEFFKPENVKYTAKSKSSTEVIEKTMIGYTAEDFEYTDKNLNVTFAVEDGSLEITPAAITVNVTGENVSKTYDGTEYTATRVTFSSESEFFKTENVKYTAKSKSSTDVIEKTMIGYTAEDFEYTDKNLKVTFEVEDGTIVIEPRPVRISVSGSSKKYGDVDPFFAQANMTGNLDGELGDLPLNVIRTNKDELVDVYDDVLTIGSDAEPLTKEALDSKYTNYVFTIIPGSFEILPQKGDISKSHTPKEEGYKAGQTVLFTIKAKNIYNKTMDIILVEQENVALTQSSFKNVSAGEEIETTAEYTVTEKDIVRGQFTNTVTLVYPETLVSYFENDVVAVEAMRPSIVVEKVPLNGLYTEGDEIEYTIAVTNNGNVVVTDIKVEDDLTRFKSTIGELAAGDTKKLTTVYTVTAEDIKKQTIVNTATAEGKDPTGKDVKSSGSYTIGTENPDAPSSGDKPVLYTAAVKVTKEASEDAALELNQEITYTVTVENIGNVTVTLDSVTDSLVDGVALTGDDVKLNKFELKPGESDAVSYTYKITSDIILAGKLENEVFVKYTDPNGKNVLGGDKVTVTAEPIDTTVTVIKESDKEDMKVGLGDIITYTIKVKNDGNVPFYNVVVTDEKAQFTQVIDALAVNEERTFEVPYVVIWNDLLVGEIVNSVNVIADSVPDADPEADDHIPYGEAECIDEPVDVYTMTVNYWKDTVGGEKAAETFTKIYIDGDYFNIVSPDVYGYTPDRELVSGYITADTTIDVIYEREYFNLVIHYIYEDGSTALEDYRDRLYVGESFTVSSPALGGYTASRNEVYGTMQYSHLAFTVVYVGNTTVIDDYVTPLGLPSVMSDAGECFE